MMIDAPILLSDDMSGRDKKFQIIFLQDFHDHTYGISTVAFSGV
jgi:hypothetical protein